ncbi:hypothetical protein V6R21_05325 [Limibacter armeniacum]|uniref:HYC_CC_PP family protein n=1 Tax=Limibacter armeniacum TaxID=466084 RepID=UPI002FE68C03
MKQLISILLVFTVLLGNIGLTIGTHYCGGQAVEHAIAFGNHELGCGMQDIDICAEPTPDADHIQAAACCQDATLLVQAEDGFTPAFADFSFLPALAAVTIHFLFQLFFFPETDTQSPQTYSPPLLKWDIQSLFQTFLL